MEVFLIERCDEMSNGDFWAFLVVAKTEFGARKTAFDMGNLKRPLRDHEAFLDQERSKSNVIMETDKFDSPQVIYSWSMLSAD